MSIPVSIDPMGTLGARPDYVKDGLVLWFDGLLEPAAPHDYITNFATGETIALAAGSIRREGAGLVAVEQAKCNPFQKTDNLCIELIARGIPEIKVAYIGIRPWRGGYIFRYINTGSYSKNAFRWVNNDTYDCAERDGELMGYYVTKTGWHAYIGEMVKGWSNGAQTSYDFTMSTGCPFLHALRVYNRPLTEEEQSHNWKIDKLRFGE